MVFTKIPIQTRNVDARLKALSSWIISTEDKKAIPTFLKDLAVGKVNIGNKISEGRQLKYLDSLKVALTNLRKPTSRLTVADIERLDMGLTKNDIRRQDGRPYAEETKAEIKRFLKVYLRWRFRDNPKRVFDLTSWLDTKVRKLKTPNFLTEAEVMKLYDACEDARGRFIVAVLFDSGARAEEFYNIRLEDVERPSGPKNYYRIHLKEEYSKTKGRMVPLFWEKSPQAMDDYLALRISEGIKAGDRVYAGTYDAMRFFLKRLGIRVLTKRVHPHLLRHSAATYYASKLNRQQLCKRFGWAFKSDMPDVYINRAGVEESEMEERFTQTDLGVIKSQLEKQQREAGMLREQLQDTERRLAATENQVCESGIFNALLESDPELRTRLERLVALQPATMAQSLRDTTRVESRSRPTIVGAFKRTRTSSAIPGASGS